MFYFEYPAVVSLMLHEVRYGVELRLTTVAVKPLSATDFDLPLGPDGAYLGYYGGTEFFAQLPGGHTGLRTFELGGMADGAYAVSPSGRAGFEAQAAGGALSFTVEVGPGMSVRAVKK
jgi:hypothetical protein